MRVAAATAIDAAGGLLDGVGIGEWMHGGDVREALGAPQAYSSEGSELALELLIERGELEAALRLALRCVAADPLPYGVGWSVETV